MKAFYTDSSLLYFRQTTLPRLFFVILGQLEVYIILTGNKRYPYAVRMSESEFKSVIELAQGA